MKFKRLSLSVILMTLSISVFLDYTYATNDNSQICNHLLAPHLENQRYVLLKNGSRHRKNSVISFHQKLINLAAADPRLLDWLYKFAVEEKSRIHKNQLPGTSKTAISLLKKVSGTDLWELHRYGCVPAITTNGNRSVPFLTQEYADIILSSVLIAEYGEPLVQNPIKQQKFVAAKSKILKTEELKTYFDKLEEIIRIIKGIVLEANSTIIGEDFRVLIDAENQIDSNGAIVLEWSDFDGPKGFWTPIGHYIFFKDLSSSPQERQNILSRLKHQLGLEVVSPAFTVERSLIGPAFEVTQDPVTHQKSVIKASRLEQPISEMRATYLGVQLGLHFNFGY